MKDGIYIDCETTGLSEYDRICELTFAEVKDWRVVSMFTKRYDPGMPVTEGAAAINGLDWDRDLKGQAEFEPLELERFFTAGLPLIAYNAAFDRRMLSQEFGRWNMPLPKVEWVDALAEARDKLSLPRYRQVDVAEHFGISTKGSHSAQGDVEMLVQMCKGLDAVEPPPPAVAQSKDVVLEDFANRLRQTLEVTQALEAATEYDSVIIDSAINNLQAMKNELDKERKRIVADATSFVRAVNGEFKKVKDGIDTERTRLDGLVKGYLMKQDTLAQPAAKPTVGSAVREKTYKIMYGQVNKDQVGMEFLRLDEFAIECEVKRQMAAGIDPPRITGVPLELDYIVKRRAK